MRQEMEEVGEDQFLDDDEKILRRLRKKTSAGDPSAYERSDLAEIEMDELGVRA